ncbi:hypothetical protein SAMN06297280_1474 [Arsukibacterium tuosuense]|uniref:Lipoprotein n=1 Tax=Arsukibacterium tuosuense TaxID=1323745 RepID=A0A285INP1_9GAMM|nr:hypothetical protein [Arsukibacterium tuosuense]SNY49598.1 hypothetical protein SAMN06297280_1474 [Arsukibacterium tuosuense]
MRIFQLLMLVLLLTGCGGGGSSDGDGGIGGGPGSGSNPGLVINDDNALYIATITSLSNDTLTSLAQLAVLAHDELNAKPRAVAVTRPVFCENGLQAIELVKRTVSDTYYLGANQRFSIVFNQCQLAELEAEITGELDVLVRSVTLDGYSLDISDADYLLSSRNLQLKDEEGTVQVSVEINNRYSARNQQYSYVVTPAGSSLAFTLPDNKIEQFRSFNTRLILNNQIGRYELSTNGTLQSDVLSGSITVSTVTPQSGQIQRLPNSGELRFQAGGTSTMRLSSIDANTGILANIILPELGLGGQVDWLELSTGASWQKKGLAKNYIWREQRDFVNLEAEWLTAGQNMMVNLLPEQPILLHFSNVVTELGGYGSRLVLTAVDEQGLNLFGVPEIDVDIMVLGTVVQLQPAVPLLAGYRYRLGSAFARNNSNTLASVPFMYAQLVDELSGTVELTSTLFHSGQVVEVYPDIRSDLGPAMAAWQTDSTVFARRDLANHGVELTLANAPLGSYLSGILSLELSNARGNHFTINQPYIVIDEQLTDYFYNSTQPMSAASSADVMLAPIDTQNDIGNDAGIYTSVSGFSADGQSWSLWLRTGDGGILQPGSYLAGAEDNFSEPHLKVIIAGRSCSTQNASFTVQRAEYDDENIFVKGLSADYDLICQYNKLSYQYRGSIRYRRAF